MPSPFPGMDPFLEQEGVWPGFQHQFIGSLFQILLPNLVDRYRARVGQRVYHTEMPLFTSVIREEHCEEFIEVRNRSAHAPTAMSEAHDLSHIRKSPIPIVSEELVSVRPRALRILQFIHSGATDQEDVQQSVAVIVKDSNAAAN